jgi:hypothetical protein
MLSVNRLDDVGDLRGSIYDFENAGENIYYSFTFTAPSSGTPIYFTAETYSYNIVPQSCTYNSAPTMKLRVYVNGNLLA